MQNKYYETLLANAVEKSALQHEQIGQIINSGCSVTRKAS